MTAEVGDEAFDRVGALEAIPKIAPAQVVPELCFCLGRMLAQLAHFDQQRTIDEPAAITLAHKLRPILAFPYGTEWGKGKSSPATGPQATPQRHGRPNLTTSAVHSSTMPKAEYRNSSSLPYGRDKREGSRLRKSFFRSLLGGRRVMDNWLQRSQLDDSLGHIGLTASHFAVTGGIYARG